MTVGSEQDTNTLLRFRLQDAETQDLVQATNLTVADEASLKKRIAVVRLGQPLSSSLEINADKGWFQPMLGDLLRNGVSVVVNDIPITDAFAATIGSHIGLPPEWITQQNLYITPSAVQGFDPHCDPHIVIVVHLYGRKEWTIYDKTLENPVYDADTNTVAQGDNAPEPCQKIVVEPGDCFVIPRGLYHSAIALSPASVHMAVGAAGARAVDYVWAMAQEAVRDARMRADLSPESALQAARAFVTEFNFEPLHLPRFPRMEFAGAGAQPSLSFKDVLDALQGG